MTTEFLELLRQGLDRPVRWTDLLVTNNVAAIPPVNETPGDFVWNRGFNVVVLDRWGTARHFCKCRGHNDTKMAHESSSMVSLHAVPELTQHIPRVMQLESRRFRVMVTPFLRGAPLNGVLEGAYNKGFERVVHRAIDGIVKLSLHATEALPQLVEQPVRDLALQAAPLLDHLANIGLSSEDTEVLARILSCGQGLSPQLQHGDLWSANIIQHRRQLWFIDFEMFGAVQVPMYDVFHFLRTCTDAWARGPDDTWTDRMMMAGPASEMVRSCVTTAGRRLGLESRQIAATLVFYVAHFSVTTHKRNPDGVVWKPFFREVKALAGALRQDAQAHRYFLRPAA